MTYQYLDRFPGVGITPRADDNLDDCGELQDMVKRWEAELEEYVKACGRITDAGATVSDALGNLTGELWKIEAELLDDQHL